MRSSPRALRGSDPSPRRRSRPARVAPFAFLFSAPSPPPGDVRQRADRGLLHPLDRHGRNERLSRRRGARHARRGRRIASAVESAVAMGFDADAATETHWRDHQYPGCPGVVGDPSPRSSPTATWRRRARPAAAPPSCLIRYADAAAAAAERGIPLHSGAIDLTEDSPGIQRRRGRLKHRSTRANGNFARRGTWVRRCDDDDRDGENDRTPNRPGRWTSPSARWPRNGARGNEALAAATRTPRGPFAAAPRSTAGDALARRLLVGSGGSGGGGPHRLALTGEAARARRLARRRFPARILFGGSGIVDALLSGGVR